MENKELNLAEEFVLKTNRNVFLTGKAGTGKTTFLKSILGRTKKNVVIVAPTGVAAINAGGITIHSLFQLPTTAFIPTAEFADPVLFTNSSELAKVQKLRREKRQILLELDLLVIDEISMVRADLLDAIDLTLKRIRKSKAVFGGAQILAIGDLFQLSPVNKEHIWNTLSKFYKSPFFFSSWSWKSANPISIELQKVYRQSDEKFIGLLNRIRNGVKDKDDIHLLNQHYKEQIDSDEITLTTHNNTANKINKDQLSKLKTPVITLEAEITGRFYESSYPTLEKIILKKGAQIMFIRNHPEGLYFNGKLGKVLGQKDEFLKIELADEGKSILVEKDEWKNTSYKVDKESKEIIKEDVGSFFQYPIRLAWAVTVHKSQGLTFDSLQLDLERTFAAGQLYVALSRCRSLEGLRLLSKIKPENIIVDKLVLGFYDSIGESDSLLDQLEESKIDYSNSVLKSSFTFVKYMFYLDEWEQYVIEKQPDNTFDILNLLSEIKKAFLNIVNTADKFKMQLDSLFGHKDYSAAISRSDTAIRYFTDELNAKIILALESHIDKYRSQKEMRTYLKQVQKLLDEFWLLIQSMYKIKYKGKEIFTGEIKHKPIQFFSRKKKYKKGDTYEQSLELFKKGHSLQEIADLRLMAKSTVEGHMLKHLKASKVDILDLMEKTRFDKIYRYIQKNSSKSVVDLVKSCDFSLEYVEVRWVKAALELMNV